MPDKPLTLIGYSFMLLMAAGCSDDGDEPSEGTGGSTAETGGAAGSSSGGTAQGQGGSTPSAGGSGDQACQTEADVTSPSTSASDACRAFCQVEDDCNPATTPADCEDYRSCAAEDMGSPSCTAAAKVYWDCLRAQSNICEPEACCDNQASAVQAACAE